MLCNAEQVGAVFPSYDADAQQGHNVPKFDPAQPVKCCGKHTSGTLQHLTSGVSARWASAWCQILILEMCCSELVALLQHG